MNTQLARSEFKMLYLTVMNIEMKGTYMKMLQKMIDIENQLIAYLPKMAENADDEELVELLSKYTRDITIQRDRVRRILLKHRMPSTGEHNEVFAKFVNDMEKDMLRISEREVRDSFIVSTIQMIKHIRSSKYKTLIEWADFLKERDDEELLEATLYEEEVVGGEIGLFSKERAHTLSDMREMAYR